MTKHGHKRGRGGGGRGGIGGFIGCPFACGSVEGEPLVLVEYLKDSREEKRKKREEKRRKEKKTMAQKHGRREHGERRWERREEKGREGERRGELTVIHFHVSLLFIVFPSSALRSSFFILRSSYLVYLPEHFPDSSNPGHRTVIRLSQKHLLHQTRHL